MTQPVNPDRRRRALELRREGLSVREIGRRLGISGQAAWTLVRKAEKARKAERDAESANPGITPGEAIQESTRTTVRVPTRLDFLGYPRDEIEAEPDAAHGWDSRRWRGLP